MVKLSKKTIGLLGGSFDPVHKGHLAISKIALKKIKLDQIYWLITKKNPFKEKTADNLKRILVINKLGKIEYFTKDELGFKYRSSNLTDELIGLKADFSCEYSSE